MSSQWWRLVCFSLYAMKFKYVHIHMYHIHFVDWKLFYINIKHCLIRCLYNSKLISEKYICWSNQIKFYLFINIMLSSLQVLWTFSIYLESVAILPQLFLVSKTGEAESITSHYLFALGSYRALYLLNWVSKVVTATLDGNQNLISILCVWPCFNMTLMIPEI